METIKVLLYQTDTNKTPFTSWFEDLDAHVQRVIAVRLDRVSVGNFGDCSLLRGGVWELRIHAGPGYRIYFGKQGDTVVIILCGGLKKSQKKDIEKALEYWEHYKGQHG